MDWPTIKKKLSAKNSTLANKLDEVARETGKPLPVHCITYSYGDMILNHGKLNVAESLSAQPFAFGVPLSRGLEGFITENAKIIPISMLEPGQHFNLDPDLCSSCFPLQSQTITAGARSTFLVQRISNSNRFWRLMGRHHLSFDMPRTLFEQWQLFVQIAQNSLFNWQCEVLLFSEEWIARQDSLAVFELKKYLHEHQKPHPEFANKKLNFSRILGHVMTDLDCKSPYFASTLKQVFAIAAGFMPGFVVANSDLFVPLDEIRNAFFYDYGGMKTLPDMIVPGYPAPEVKCFYSLELETLLEQHGRRSKDNSCLEALKTMQMIYSRLIRYITEQQIHDPEISRFLEAEIAFIHDQAGSLTSINQSRKKDSLAFLSHSTFARKGCASIELLKAA